MKAQERRAEEWLRKGRWAWSEAQRLVAFSYRRSYDELAIRERGRGQFPQARQSEALQERISRREAQPTIDAGEFLDKFVIPKFYNEPTLDGVEEPIDFCLADRLPKGDAGEHFERRFCETRIPIRSVLFS